MCTDTKVQKILICNLMKSKITGGETDFLFSEKVLGKYDVKYYRCRDTGFIQTEEPYWLNEAYSNAITKLDLGLVQRNIDLSKTVYPVILQNFDPSKKFLDYAGGYALFTRLMRNKGIDFYNTDPYCENIFAEEQDLKYLPVGQRFELETAFEVFEHLPDPVAGMEDMLKYSDSILFSTVIVPKSVSKDWWYYSFETGQHVAFYTLNSLKFLAEKFGLNFYSNGTTLHLFTRKNLSKNPFKLSPAGWLIKKAAKKLDKLETKFYGKRQSLLDEDIANAKMKLKEK